MKVAAIAMNAAFADVKANLEKAEKLLGEASKTDTELVLFPEFFTSAIGFSDKMLDIAVDNSCVYEFLTKHGIHRIPLLKSIIKI